MEFIEFDKLTTVNSNNMLGVHSHDHYEIYILLDGERNFIIGEHLFNVLPNRVVVVPPYVMHKTLGTPYSRVCIFVTPSVLSENQKNMLNDISEQGTVRIEEEYISSMLQILEEALKLQNEPIKDKHRNLGALLDVFLFYLSKQRSFSSKQTFANKFIPNDTIALCNYLNEHYTEEFSLDDLCKLFFVSRATLCKNFKKTMNCTIMDYVTNLKIVKAKKLLITTHKSMSDISDECGFSSANYFGLIFKKYTGKSPLQFKKRGLSKTKRNTKTIF